MKQYKYQIVEVFLDQAVMKLNDLGKQGWRFVSFVGEAYKKPGGAKERIKLFLELEQVAKSDAAVGRGRKAGLGH